MKFTDEKIKSIQDNLGELPSAVIGHELYGDIEDALSRLAELEDAVAFKRFDEVPERQEGGSAKNIEVELLWSGGIARGIFYSPIYQDFSLPDKNQTAKDLIKQSYLGWRYPVGDMS